MAPQTRGIPRTPRWAPPPFPPWSTVAVLMCVGASVTVPAFLVLGQGATLAAAGGLMLGLYGTASLGLARVGAPAAITALACLATLLAPQMWVALGLSGAMALLAGAELARIGTRTLVMGLYAFATVRLGLSMGGELSMLATLVTGMAAGSAAAWATGMANKVPALPESSVIAVRMVVFLSVGLALAIVLASWLASPRSYWIAFLFLLRCTLPYGRQRQAALRFGAGAAAGVVLALAIEALAPTIWVQLLLALGATGIGLRYLLDQSPIPAGAFTLAILLGAAPTTAEAVFRMEAVGIVVALVFALIAVIDRLPLGGIVPARQDGAEGGP
ncbi:MAG: hypothetical protein AAFU80_03680 [Pseudomonadota bacterium]